MSLGSTPENNSPVEKEGREKREIKVDETSSAQRQPVQCSAALHKTWSKR